MISAQSDEHCLLEPALDINDRPVRAQALVPVFCGHDLFKLLSYF